MTLKLLAGCALACAAAAALSACTTTSATATAPITKAVADGLPHCHITGSFNAGVGGLAGTGTGAAQNFTFDCPGQPWAANATPATSSPPASATTP